MTKRIGIIGAGIGGVTAAKILRDFGLDVVVFEKDSEVGGVWTSSRRYPGLKTQNNRSTYSFTDFPYPRGTPEWPSGEQVQQYIESYCAFFHLNERIHLNTTVESAVLNQENTSWTLRVTNVASGSRTEIFDFLIVANGIFNEPFCPCYEGEEEFTNSGGKISHTTHFHTVDDVKGKNVVVVGYGKSACDVAMATVGTSARTTVVAKTPTWKVPYYLKKVVNIKYLILTRFGLALFPYPNLTGFQRFLHGTGKIIPWFMLTVVGKVIDSQLMLHELGLYPDRPIERVADATVNAATEGFYEAVKEGTLRVEAGVEITKLKAGKVHLSNGKVLEADCVIYGTGFQQTLPFFDQNIQNRLTDKYGNFRLYQNILPLDIPNLAFNGYNGSIFCSLSDELCAAWIGAYLTQQLTIPSYEERVIQIDERLALMDAFGRHVRGTTLAAFSMHYIEKLLEEMKCDISPFARFSEWLVPVDPRNFAVVIHTVIQRSKGEKSVPKSAKSSRPLYFCFAGIVAAAMWMHFRETWA